MKIVNKNELVGKILDELFPNPKCELNYNKDYELLISIVLSAQTTDKSVNKVTTILFNNYPTLKDLKEASISDIIDIIRPIGTFNKKAFYVKNIARILDEECNGVVPNNRKILEGMPGVGRKVCNVFLSEWYHENVIAVDTHVERVSKRLGFANDDDNVVVVERKLEKVFKEEDWGKRHLQLVLFGRYMCKSIKPLCMECKLKNICNYNKKRS